MSLKAGNFDQKEILVLVKCEWHFTGVCGAFSYKHFPAIPIKKHAVSPTSINTFTLLILEYCHSNDVRSIWVQSVILYGYLSPV